MLVRGVVGGSSHCTVPHPTILDVSSFVMDSGMPFSMDAGLEIEDPFSTPPQEPIVVDPEPHPEVENSVSLPSVEPSVQVWLPAFWLCTLGCTVIGSTLPQWR